MNKISIKDLKLVDIDSKWQRDPGSYKYAPSIFTDGKRVYKTERIWAHQGQPSFTFEVMDEEIIVEYLSMSMLDHPNIVKVKNLKIDEHDRLCIVMKKYHSDLHRFDRKKITASKSNYYLLSALQCIHANGIVHADIKPDNIFLDENIIPYIGDFGVSILQSDYLYKHIRTHVSYRWPESKIGEITTKSDIWSMGMVFLDVLYKQNFNHWIKNNKDIKRLLEPGNILHPESFDSLMASGSNTWNLFSLKQRSELKTIIFDMLKFNPNERKSAAELLQSPLFLKYQRIPIKINPSKIMADLNVAYPKEIIETANFFKQGFEQKYKFDVDTQYITRLFYYYQQKNAAPNIALIESACFIAQSYDEDFSKALPDNNIRFYIKRGVGEAIFEFPPYLLFSSKITYMDKYD